MDFNIFKVPKDKNWGIQFRKSIEVLAGVAQFLLLLLFSLILIVLGGIAYALKSEDPTPWIRGTCMIKTIYGRPCNLEVQMHQEKKQGRISK